MVVLDNFEQVTGAGPELLRLIEAAPRLTVVVTSRRVPPPLRRARLPGRPARRGCCDRSLRPSALGHWIRDRSPPPMIRTWGRSAAGWTGCRSRSSWPRRAPRCSPLANCSTGSEPASPCSPAGPAISPPASRPSATPSTGARRCLSPAERDAAGAPRRVPERHLARRRRRGGRRRPGHPRGSSSRTACCSVIRPPRRPRVPHARDGA